MINTCARGDLMACAAFQGKNPLITYDFGDGTIMEDTWETTVNHTYLSYGDLEVIANASNNVSEVSFVCFFELKFLSIDRLELFCLLTFLSPLFSPSLLQKSCSLNVLKRAEFVFL